jgi:hypothetical protein
MSEAGIQLEENGILNPKSATVSRLSIAEE